jgi:hypothetical protein
MLYHHFNLCRFSYYYGQNETDSSGQKLIVGGFADNNQQKRQYCQQYELRVIARPS